MKNTFGAAIIFIGLASSATAQTDLNVVKTCDPIVPVASGPMTMNCRLVVTGDNFTSVDNLRLGDFFAAGPPANPSDAIISGTMANASNLISNEAWSCIELLTSGGITSGANMAVCGLSGADLIAAGGSSTIDMSFDFTVANDADQVVNCAVIEIEEQPCTNCTQTTTPAEEPTPDAGGNNGEIPDYCVILDVPDYTGTTVDPGDPIISDLDPDITSITKTCEAPVAGMHSGQLGMLWNCQINVTTDTTPFAGSLTVSDFQNLTSGSFGNTQNQITSISSVSGNFDCSQGQSCVISGADFDSNGEVIDVSLFVTSDQLNTAVDNTTYQLQNCAQGSYVTSAGVNQTIAGNCVNAPWEPVSSIAKTCDPVAPVTSGPMTMNCQITVTGTNLPTDGYLFFGDVFVAPQPASATDVSVNGPMTNITSNESWTCIDASGGNGTGYCELSSADLFAAGGTSTVNMSFQFDVDNDPARAVNCVAQYVNSAPIVDALAGQQNSSASSNDNLPDICAYVDLPVDPEPTLPTIDLKKTCKEPESTTRNGVQGFNWTCHIYLDISPTPFDGTFTFYEDASAINVGGAEFISASVPCQGIGTDLLTCEMDGATTPASQIIQVDLFTAQVDDEKVIEWENCASGTLTVDGSDVLEAPKSCVVTYIKPVSSPPVEKVNLKKSCTSPQPTMLNGVQGFSWECDIAITAIPVPFAGTFTLDEDASNISIGTAQFTAASVPCQGIGSEYLSCELDGSTMSSTEIVHVNLFTAQVSEDEIIEWENCAKGVVNSANGEMGTEASCVRTRIKPVTTPVDPPKEVFLKKSCGEPEAATHNGVAGVAWSCEITAIALPAPFAGTFTFIEDATGVSGSNNANIIGVHPANNAWACSPAVPAQQTACTISGGAFNPSGVETITFDLFAETHGDKPVEWENCVGGVYAFDGDKREIKGNCENMTWKPTGEPIDPTFRIRKECKLVDTTSNAANYACSIYIDQANSDPFSGTLTVQDLFHYQGGNSTLQYISNMQGLPANWTCGAAPFTNGASCEISATNFMANTGNRIDVQLTIPYNAFAKGGFENCAALELNGEVAANSNCVPIEPPKPATTEYDVTKTCKASGPRQQFSNTIWFEPYQCVITVTTNGVPFTDPLYVVDALTAGGNSQAVNIQSISSSDPWNCSPFPFTPPNPNDHPGCVILGSNFPHSVGSSTLIVNMMMNAGNALLGTENCANLSTLNAASGQLTPIDSDCVTIFDPAPPLVPVLDVVKTCEPAVQNGNVWNVDCTITVTGQNLPAGETIRISDEMFSAGQNHAVAGQISQTGSTFQCGGGMLNTGYASSCDISVDDLVANGGTLVFDYSGVINGPGGYILGQGPNQTTGYPQNCAYADIASAGIHGPDNAGGKSCVSIPLELSAVVGNPGGPIIEWPATPVDPGTTGEVEECSTDVLFVVDQSGSMNLHGRLGKTRLAIQAAMNVFQGNGSAAGLVTFSDQGQIVIAPAEVIPSGNMLSAVLGLNGNGATNWAAGLAKARVVVTAATNKPLVLFITDGGPNRPLGPDQWGLPPIEVAAMRAQGSTVIGIGLNQSFIQSALVDVFGPNVINVGNGDVVNPLINDGIIIPNNVDYEDVFEQIALAYCPTSGVAKSAGTIIDLKLPEQPYLGDDEPLEETTEVQTPTPMPEKPELRLVKEATGHCLANRDTQKYDCGFRLTITNIGQTRHTGPVAITDDFGKPTPRSAKVTSSGGWTCDKPRGGSMACINRNLDLQPGDSSIIDMTLKIPGLRDGGRFQNCAEIGVGDNRAGRVAIVQEIMNQRGLNAGPVDGQPGRKTYAALTQLQQQLGLPQSREFDDALFTALGITIGTQQSQSCVVVDLPVMPAPPLQCNKASTTARGDACVCRYDNMYQRNATSCGCQEGYDLVNGRGCVEKPDPVIPHDPPKPRCQNGLPRVNGRCLVIEINPKNNDAAGADGCRIKVGGICIK